MRDDTNNRSITTEGTAADERIVWLSAAQNRAVDLMTRIVNFPINDAMMTWSAAAPPSNVRDLWAPGAQLHTVRHIRTGVERLIRDGRAWHWR